MFRNPRVWTIILVAVGMIVLMALVSCGTPPPPQPQAEARICATDTADPIRVPDQDCIDGKPGVVWLVGNDSLGPDDYTPVGAPVDDEYLEDDEPEVAPKAHTPKHETKKPKPTKKPQPTKR